MIYLINIHFDAFAQLFLCTEDTKLNSKASRKLFSFLDRKLGFVVEIYFEKP